VLKQVAKDAITKNFPTYDSASGYGAAVVTSEGNIFSSGQYSSFEKRLNIHAEMGAVLNSLMHQRKNIIALALVSSKFKDVPCEICGCCRQFLSEMSSRFNLNLTYYCFALETDAYKTYTLEELLPSPWSSLKK
jgi:cytidine deaminase